MTTSAALVEASRKYGTVQWFEQEYRKVPQDPWGLGWRRSQLLRYQRMLAMLDGIEPNLKRVLDVGCATGDFTFLLSKRLPHLEDLTGIDFVTSAIERAQARFPELSFGNESVFSIGEKYAGRFDLVACLEVLYYLEPDQQRVALRSIKQAIRPGGYAIFSSLIASPPHFSPDDLRQLVGREFTIVHSEILHLRLVSLYEKVVSRSERLLSRFTQADGRERVSPKLVQLPLPAVAAVERWSRSLRSLAASHTLLLGKAR